MESGRPSPSSNYDLPDLLLPSCTTVMTLVENEPGSGVRLEGRIRPINPTARAGRRARRIVFHSPDTVVLGGRFIRLRAIEYDLLKTLAMGFPDTVSGWRLLRATWGQHANGRFNYLKQYIQFLRTDVERNPSVPEVIITERGGGYRLAVPPTFY